MDHFTLITKAFRTLRSAGIVARQNHECCQSCAGARITSDIKAMPDAKRSPLRGAVYTTRQDVSGAHNRRGEFTGMCISFGALAEKATDTEIGQALTDALRAEGLTVRWDGDPATRVEVCPSA